jgi:hypothetical protein
MTVEQMINRLNLLLKKKMVKRNDVLFLISNSGKEKGFRFEGFMENIMMPPLGTADPKAVAKKIKVVNMIAVMKRDDYINVLVEGNAGIVPLTKKRLDNLG